MDHPGATPVILLLRIVAAAAGVRLAGWLSLDPPSGEASFVTWGRLIGDSLLRAGIAPRRARQWTARTTGCRTPRARASRRRSSTTRRCRSYAWMSPPPPQCRPSQGSARRAAPTAHLHIHRMIGALRTYLQPMLSLVSDLLGTPCFICVAPMHAPITVKSADGCGAVNPRWRGTSRTISQLPVSRRTRGEPLAPGRLGKQCMGRGPGERNSRGDRTAMCSWRRTRESL